MADLTMSWYRVSSWLLGQPPIRVGPDGRPPVVIGPSQPIPIGPAPQTHASAPDLQLAGQRPWTVVGPARGVVVEAPPRAYWDERGWVPRQRAGREEYVGEYRVLDPRLGAVRAFAGRVTVESNAAVPWITAPPPEVARHPKWPCFHHRGGGVFCIRWHRPARHPDEAILYVERVLAESLGGASGG